MVFVWVSFANGLCNRLFLVFLLILACSVFLSFGLFLRKYMFVLFCRANCERVRVDGLPMAMDGLAWLRFVDGSNFSKIAKRQKVAFVCLRPLHSFLTSSSHVWFVHNLVSIRLTVACGSSTHIDSKERTRPCFPLRTLCVVVFRVRKGRLGRMTFERQRVW